MGWIGLCNAVATVLLLAAPAIAQDFPEGAGKETVVRTCGGCHDINRLKIGYTPEGWRNIERMMRNMETPVSEAEWPVVTEYLTTKIPERARPAAVIVPGPVQAEVKL